MIGVTHVTLNQIQNYNWSQIIGTIFAIITGLIALIKSFQTAEKSNSAKTIADRVNGDVSSTQQRVAVLESKVNGNAPMIPQSVRPKAPS